MAIGQSEPGCNFDGPVAKCFGIRKNRFERIDCRQPIGAIEGKLSLDLQRLHDARSATPIACRLIIRLGHRLGTRTIPQSRLGANAPHERRHIYIVERRNVDSHRRIRPIAIDDSTNPLAQLLRPIKSNGKRPCPKRTLNIPYRSLDFFHIDPN